MTRCNCSICHRLGALWAYYDSDSVRIESSGKPVDSYAWGDKTLTYHRCGICGCTTHYTSSGDDEGELIAINCRMAPSPEIDSIPVRRFDGLDSWQYLDN